MARLLWEISVKTTPMGIKTGKFQYTQNDLSKGDEDPFILHNTSYTRGTFFYKYHGLQRLILV